MEISDYKFRKTTTHAHKILMALSAYSSVKSIKYTRLGRRIKAPNRLQYK